MSKVIGVRVGDELAAAFERLVGGNGPGVLRGLIEEYVRRGGGEVDPPPPSAPHRPSPGKVVVEVKRDRAGFIVGAGGEKVELSPRGRRLVSLPPRPGRV